MKIRSKKYAERAYPLVEKLQADKSIKENAPEEYSEQKKLEKEYRTLALTFPTMIMQSGLAQAIGFLMAKDKPHHKKLLEHLKDLLNNDNLHSSVLSSNIVTYQKLTRDAIEATSWLKRYTQALLSKEGDNS